MADTTQNKATVTPQPMGSAQGSGRFASLYGHSRRRTVLINLGVVVLVIAVVVGAVLWSHRTHTVSKPLDKNGQPIYQQSFTKTHQLVVTGSAGTTGATLSLPNEFGTRATAKGEASFNETTSNAAGQEVPLAELAIDTFAQIVPESPSDLAYFAKTMNSSSTNQAAVAPLNVYVSHNMPTGYTVKMGAVKAFTNSSIKTNAWIIDATATATDPSNKNLGDQQGQVIYAVTSKGTYYFMVMATGYNWTNNQSAWQNVFASLKVDQ